MVEDPKEKASAKETMKESGVITTLGERKVTQRRKLKHVRIVGRTTLECV